MYDLLILPLLIFGGQELSTPDRPVTLDFDNAIAVKKARSMMESLRNAPKAQSQHTGR